MTDVNVFSFFDNVADRSSRHAVTVMNLRGTFIRVC